MHLNRSEAMMSLAAAAAAPAVTFGYGPTAAAQDKPLTRSSDQPVREQDEQFLGMLADLGIEKGKPFRRTIA
jgi:hypothetical protein